MDTKSADFCAQSDQAGPTGATSRRVMLVADHFTWRQALRRALEDHGLTVATDAPPGREAVVAAVGAVPQVVLIDLSGEITASLETCRAVRQAVPQVSVVALAPRASAAAHAARAAGASGVVTTDVSVADLAEFLSSLPERHSHRTPAAKTTSSCVLSRRELEVLALVAHGLADGQIARSLYLSIKTVKNHLHHIYAKLGARSRTEAVVVAARQGLIRL